jgi:NADH:ubiquinone oxidoreductase subunit 2 (subunit N)
MEKRIGALGAAFLFGGFLLVFGAVGGMDNPEQAQYFTEQLVMAVVGLFWMWIGTRFLADR